MSNEPKTRSVSYNPFADDATGIVKSFTSTPAQREIWTSIMMSADASKAFNESITLSFKTGVDLEALQSALKDLVERHEALRATFSSDGMTINIDAVSSPQSNLGLNTEQTLDNVILDQTLQPFDLVNGPLIRWCLIKDEAGSHLVLTAHHIICDGWTLGILVQDLSKLYNHRINGQALNLEPAFSFSDYAAQLESTDEDYWLQRFSDCVPEFDLPHDLVRPKTRTFESKRIDIPVNEKIAASVESTAAKIGCSVPVFTMAVYLICLSKWTSETLVSAGLPLAGQPSLAPETLAGHCVTTAPIAIEVDSTETFSAFTGRLSETTLDAYEHQKFTYGQLLQRLNVARDASRIPLIPALFNYDFGIEEDALKFSGTEVLFRSNPRQFENFEMFVNLAKYSHGTVLECQFSTALFSDESILQRLEEYIYLLACCSENPQFAIDQYGLTDRDISLPKQLSLLSGSAKEWSKDCQDLSPRLSHIAQENSDEEAVVSGQNSLSYSELEQRANDIAHYLIAQNVSPGQHVGVCIDRSEQMLATLLGVWKVGASYVPLDPEFPIDRLTYMVSDANIEHLLTQEHYQDLIPGVSHKHLVELIESETQPNNTLPDSIDSETPAYMIYTSGSTGKPKGVVVPRRAVANFLNSMAKEPGLEAQDRLLAVTTLSFDIAVLELFLPLWVGATVVIASKQEASDARSLTQLLSNQGITCMQATPATWRMLINASWSGTQVKVLCGGEALPQDLIAPLIDSSKELWNMYGPTETTVWSTCAHITDPNEAVPLGKAIANTQLYVLDEKQRPLPNGIAGELYIGGEGVTLGYHQRDDLNAKHFIENPFGSGVIYRTGDKVRYLHDGTLQYLGRLDQQVKVRGFRIELGDIESAMRTHDAVRDCAVVVRELRPGDVRLVAFVEWEQNPFTLTDMRAFLKEQLPAYMIPQHLEGIDALPRTLNNKLDRKALGKLGFESSKEKALSEDLPTSLTEIELHKLWEEVLRAPVSSIHEDFFALGGHSLLIGQLIQKMEDAFNKSFSFKDLYDYASISALSAKIDQSDISEKSHIPRQEDGAITILSLAQQRLWYLERLNGPSSTYNLPSAFKLKGDLDSEALNRAFRTLLARQSCLRYAIVEIDGVPEAHLRNMESFEIPVLRIEGNDGAVQDDIVHHLSKEQNSIFDLSSDCLFKVFLVKLLDSQAHVLFFMPHHIVFDGWSFDIFVNELSTLYDSETSGQPAQLEEISITYGDYAHWSRQEKTASEYEKQIEYWLDLLADTPSLNLETDYPRPEVKQTDGEEISFSLDPSLVRSLAKVALDENASLFMVIYAAYACLLYRYSGQDDLVIATPMADRSRSEIENIIGFFVNALALRFKLDASQTVSELIQDTKTTLLEAFNHKDAPFEAIVDRLQPERDMSRTPVYQTSITYQDIGRRAQKMGVGQHALDIEQLDIPSDVSVLDLNIWFKRSGDHISGALVYSTSLFKRETAKDLIDYFKSVLEGFVRNKHDLIGDIVLQDSRSIEATQSVGVGSSESWPENQRDLSNRLSHIAQENSDEEAVVSGQNSLSYSELEQRANDIAHYLIAQNVSPGQHVGVCIDRSEQMLATLLGVWKVGASYVPLDPEFPIDRLTYMVSDANIEHLLTQEHYQDLIPGVSHKHLVELIESETQPNNTLPDSIDSETPAYMIYTSGSTGKPKGVVVPRRAVANFLNSMAKEPGLEAQDRLLAVTTLSFDIAVLELFLPLWVGATVVIASKQEASDARSLTQLLSNQGITCMQATPATWRMLINASWSGTQVKVLCGGEALPQDLIAPLIDSSKELWNMYGPTETTVWSTCAHITDPNEAVPLGKAIANTQLYVLDEKQRPLPNGIAGELYIGGEGVTLGYHQRDDLNAKHFIENPFGSGVIYRTGDKVRYLHDGTLQYLGRLDQQVKVRGFRIELGDIESAMRTHDAVRDCAVVVRELRPGDVRLVAFVEWEQNPFTLTDMRAFLKEQLPAYMIPQHLEGIDALPRTLNNKLDRKALGLLLVSNVNTNRTDPPASNMEQNIAKIWSELTGNDSVNRQDTFFEVGGHSLLSMQAIQIIEQRYEVSLKPRDLLLENLAEISRKVDLGQADIEGSPKAKPQPEQQMGEEKTQRKGIMSLFKNLSNKQSK